MSRFVTFGVCLCVLLATALPASAARPKKSKYESQPYVLTAIPGVAKQVDGNGKVLKRIVFVRKVRITRGGRHISTFKTILGQDIDEATAARRKRQSKH